MSFTHPCRQGSALALVMAFVIIGTLIVATSSNFVVERQQIIETRSLQDEALGSLETVLTRYETDMLRMARDGDPALFLNMHQNYGQERVGRSLVRWKIEPAVIEEVERVDDTINTDDSPLRSNRRYITNPLADFDIIGDDPNQVPNDFTYLYRIAGEARVIADGASWNVPEEDVLSRVQAVRYVAMNKKPVFRYAIFYAQEGTKGDLEFTHAAPLQVTGAVQANGAIYLGGDSRVNNMGALTSSRGATRIGPDAEGNGVRVNGVDGIFRFDKKSFFTALNGATWSPALALALPAPYDGSGTGVTSSEYATDEAPRIGEEGPRPAYRLPLSANGDVELATFGGTVVNPNRVADSTLSTSGATETFINDIELLPGNDSRDGNWKFRAMGPEADGGFLGFARTRVNGGGVLKLPPELGRRAFEAQQLSYRDLDGDPTEDEHEYARPLFLDLDGNLTTAAAATLIEAPGRYLRYAMGETPETIANQPLFAFRRRSATNYPANYVDAASEDAHHYNGWDVVSNFSTGDRGSPSVDGVYGLVVRERPQPDLSYLPGVEPVASDSPLYMPYAYGKAYRQPIWPLHAIDVTDQRFGGHPDDVGNTHHDAGLRHNASNFRGHGDYHNHERSLQRQFYRGGGRVLIEAAQNPGPNDSDGDWDWRQDGWDDSTSTFRQYPDYFRENWRFFHVDKPVPDLSRDGLLMEWFNKSIAWDGLPDVREVGHRLGANNQFSRPAGIDEHYYSVRFSGFITPAYSEVYTFQVKGDDGYSVWLNETLRIHQRTYDGNWRSFQVPLQAGKQYPIVMRLNESGQGDYLQLQWQSASQALEDVPRAAFNPPQDHTIERRNLAKVRMRIDTVDGPKRQKVGLMIRSPGSDVSVERFPGLSEIEAPSGGRPFVVEAEAAHRVVAGTGSFANREWQEITDIHAGANGAMQVEASGLDNNLFSSAAPTLEYDIRFAEAGDWYLNLRVRSSDTNERAVFVGIGPQYGATSWFGAAGAVPSELDHYQVKVGGAAWDTTNVLDYGTADRQLTFTVPSPGVYTVKLLMGDDGMAIDRLVFSQNPDTPEVEAEAIQTAPGGHSPLNLAEDIPLVGHSADGRSPYLALLYSPDRGVFMQYRGQKSRSVEQTQNAYFIGTKDDNGDPTDGTLPPQTNVDNGETGQSMDNMAPGRQVTLTPSRGLQTQTEWATDVRHGEQAQRQVVEEPQWQYATIDLGDGQNRELRYQQGRFRLRAWKQSWRQWRRKVEETWQWKLDVGRDNPSGQLFEDGDYHRWVRFYKNASDGDAADEIWKAKNFSIVDGRTTLQRRFEGETVTFSSGFVPDAADIPTGFTAADFDYSDPPNAYGPKIYSDDYHPTYTATGDIDHPGGTIIGTNQTIWFYNHRKPEYKVVSINAAGNVVTNWVDYDSETAFHSDLVQAGLVNPLIRNYGPTWPTVQNSPNAPRPDIQNADGTTVHGWDDIYNAKMGTSVSHPNYPPVTFSVQRQRTVYSDLHPYITRYGKWFRGYTQQWLPWADWSLNKPPLTGAFRPDQWFAGDWTAAGPAQFDPPRGLVPKRTNNWATIDWAERTDPTVERRKDADREDGIHWRDDIPDYDGVPMDMSDGRSVWLEIRAGGTDNSRATLHYAYVSGTPSASDWKQIRDEADQPVQLGLDLLGDDLLIGPCVQSGHKNSATELAVDNIEVHFRNSVTGHTMERAAPVDVLDYADWEAQGGAVGNVEDRYLASQYQVFWGPFEITEHFFAFRATDGRAIASEDWIYNPRVFANTSRWWPCGAEKEDHDNDGAVDVDMLFPLSRATRSTRELASKQTLLSINARALQDFLKTIDLPTATADRMTGGYDGTQVQGVTGTMLNEHFNGLVYAVRTNRYPWNPNIDNDATGVITNNANPWTWPIATPNAYTLGSLPSTGDDLMALAPSARATAFATLTTGGDAYDPALVRDARTVDVNSHPQQMINGSGLVVPNGRAHDGDFSLLQPYAIPNAPALKPQDFHHGVRFTDAEAIDWGLPEDANGVLEDVVFGDSKATFVTPNPLFVQGDVNTATYSAQVQGVETSGKFTPFALVGDSITIISDAWQDELWRDPGFIVDRNTMNVSGGTLAWPWYGSYPSAQSVRLNCSIITHHRPTTRRSVRDGHAASVIGTMLYLENWNQQSVTLHGSLVVMDARRYDPANLTDYFRTSGPSPFGLMGFHVGKGWAEDRLARSDHATTDELSFSNWMTGTNNLVYGRVTPVFAPPERLFEFNPDLLTSQGTPPFTPFGVSATGSGAWVKIIK